MIFLLAYQFIHIGAVVWKYNVLLLLNYLCHLLFFKRDLLLAGSFLLIILYMWQCAMETWCTVHLGVQYCYITPCILHQSCRHCSLKVQGTSLLMCYLCNIILDMMINYFKNKLYVYIYISVFILLSPIINLRSFAKLWDVCLTRFHLLCKWINISIVFIMVLTCVWATCGY